MKFTLAALALAAVARAQTRADIPSCALDCLDSAIKSDTSCSTTDYACVCENFSKLQGTATSCVVKACGADVAVNEVLPAVQALCAAVSSGAGASTAASTTAAAATTAATLQTSTTAAPATSAAATSAAASSSAAEETTKAAETKPAATTPSSNSTTPGSSPSETAVTTAGAATLGSIGGIAMLVLAALAL